MKTKLRTLTLFILAVCMTFACAVFAAACESGNEDTVDPDKEESTTPPVDSTPDYTTYTFENWKAVTDAEWDAKTISYQFVHPKYVDERGNNQTLLINLYDDGTMLFFQAGLYLTGESMSDPCWYDQDRNIVWAYFGLWQKTDDDVLDMYCFTSEADYVRFASDPAANNATAKINPFFTKSAFCYNYHATNVNGTYTIDPSEQPEHYDGYASDNVSTLMVTLGSNHGKVVDGVVLGSEAWAVSGSFTATTGSAIQYTTLQSWVNSYIGDRASFPSM